MEELNNIRDNVNKAIIPKGFSAGLSEPKTRNSQQVGGEDERQQEFDENYDNISHLSKWSIMRRESNDIQVPRNKIKPQSSKQLGHGLNGITMGPQSNATSLHGDISPNLA